MEDGATKILLSTKGVIDDVSEDMKAFLNYVDGITSQNEFVADLENAINVKCTQGSGHDETKGCAFKK